MSTERDNHKVREIRVKLYHNILIDLADDKHEEK